MEKTITVSQILKFIGFFVPLFIGSIIWVINVQGYKERVIQIEKDITGLKVDIKEMIKKDHDNFIELINAINDLKVIVKGKKDIVN